MTAVTLRWRPTTWLQVAAVAIAASPLLFNPWGLDAFQAPKVAVLLVASALGIVAILAGGVVRARVLWWAAAPAAVSVAAAVVNRMDPMAAIVGAPQRHLGIAGWLVLTACFVVGVHVTHAARDGIAEDALIIAATAVAAIGLLEQLGLDLTSFESAARLTSTFGSAAFTSGFLVLAIALAVPAALDATDRRARLVRWAGVAVLVAALALTQSRAAWLGLGAVLITLGVVGRSAVVATRRARIALAAVAVSFLTLLVVIPTLAARSRTIADPTGGTASGRVALWRIGMRAIADRPLLGWGPDSSRLALHGAIRPGFEARYTDTTIVDRAHDVVLDWMVWWGVLGTAVVLVAVVVLGRVAVRAPLTSARVGRIAAMVGFGVHLAFNFTQLEVDAPAALVAGLLVGSALLDRPLVRPVPLAVPIGASVAALAAWGTFSSLRYVAADTELRDAVEVEASGDLTTAADRYRAVSQRLPESSTFAEALTRFGLRHDSGVDASAGAARAAVARPDDPYYEELVGNSLLVAARAGDEQAGLGALALFERLARDAPGDGSLRIGLGAARLANGDRRGAEAAWLEAVDLVPARIEPALDLGLLYADEGDVEQARRWFERALELEPGNRQATDALASLG